MNERRVTFDKDQIAAYASTYTVISQSPALTILKVY